MNNTKFFGGVSKQLKHIILACAFIGILSLIIIPVAINAHASETNERSNETWTIHWDTNIEHGEILDEEGNPAEDLVVEDGTVISTEQYMTWGIIHVYTDPETPEERWFSAFPEIPETGTRYEFVKWIIPGDVTEIHSDITISAEFSPLPDEYYHIIEGVVQESHEEEGEEQYDGDPIPGASILFISDTGKKFSAISEAVTGHFSMNVPIPTDEMGWLYVTAEGYQTYFFRITWVEYGQHYILWYQTVCMDKYEDSIKVNLGTEGTLTNNFEGKYFDIDDNLINTFTIKSSIYIPSDVTDKKITIGNNNELETILMDKDDLVKLKVNALDTQHSIFKYWKKSDGTKLNPGDQIAATDEMNLIAVYSANTSSVQYDFDDGAYDYNIKYYENDVLKSEVKYNRYNKVPFSSIYLPATLTWAKDDSITVTYVKPEQNLNAKLVIAQDNRNYYNFEKWTFGGKALTKGTPVTITSETTNTKLKAVYKAEANTHKITFTNVDENIGVIQTDGGEKADYCLIPDGAEILTGMYMTWGTLEFWVGEGDDATIVYRAYAMPNLDIDFQFDQWIISGDVYIVESDLEIKANYVKQPEVVPCIEGNVLGQTGIRELQYLPIANAQITFVNENESGKTYSTISDAEAGYYKLEVPAGAYGTLSVEIEGYGKDSEKTFNITQGTISKEQPFFYKSFDLSVNNAITCSVFNELETGSYFADLNTEDGIILYENIAIEESLKCPANTTVTVDENNNLVLDVFGGQKMIIKYTYNEFWLELGNPIWSISDKALRINETETLSSDSTLTFEYPLDINIIFDKGIESYSGKLFINDTLVEEKTITSDENNIALFFDGSVSVLKENGIELVGVNKFGENVKLDLTPNLSEKYLFDYWTINDKKLDGKSEITRSESPHNIFALNHYDEPIIPDPVVPDTPTNGSAVAQTFDPFNIAVLFIIIALISASGICVAKQTGKRSAKKAKNSSN